jgi:hypothetical protein
MLGQGLRRIVALHHRSATLQQVYSRTSAERFGGPVSEPTIRPNPRWAPPGWSGGRTSRCAGCSSTPPRVTSRCVVGRVHVSILTILDAWHSKTFRDIGHLLIYYQHSFRDLYKIHTMLCRHDRLARPSWTSARWRTSCSCFWSARRWSTGWSTWPRATLSFYTVIDCHWLPLLRDLHSNLAGIYFLSK